MNAGSAVFSQDRDIWANISKRYRAEKIIRPRGGPGYSGRVRSGEIIGAESAKIHAGLKEGVPEGKLEKREHIAVQGRHWAQAGKIKGLLDYLFAERWELDYASLQDKAHKTHQEEQASEQVTFLASLQQRPAAGPSYGLPAGRGRGSFGAPKRNPLAKGGYDLTNYPGARPAPKDCCRGWWLDGICNLVAGMRYCMFTHNAEHKGKGWTGAN